MNNSMVNGTTYTNKSWKSVMAEALELGYHLEKENYLGSGSFSSVFLNKKNPDEVIKVSGCQSFKLFQDFVQAREIETECEMFGDLSEGFKHYPKAVDFRHLGYFEQSSKYKKEEYEATLYRLKKLDAIMAKDNKEHYDKAKKLISVTEAARRAIWDIYHDRGFIGTEEIFKSAKEELLEREDFSGLELSLKKAIFLGLNFIERAYNSYCVKVMFDNKKVNIMLDKDSGDIILNDIFFCI